MTQCVRSTPETESTSSLGFDFTPPTNTQLRALWLGGPGPLEAKRYLLYHQPVFPVLEYPPALKIGCSYCHPHTIAVIFKFLVSSL